MSQHNTHKQYSAIFSHLKDERDLSKLRRFVMREDFWREEILRIRKELNNRTVSMTGTMANNSELLSLYEKLIELGIEKGENNIFTILKTQKVRSNSGVSVISLLTKPYTCPGRCIYCPTEKNMPKSYLSREPAAARALAQRFDPQKQINVRLRALAMNGHPLDKIEMIVIGGTFDYYKKDYQEWFIKECFRTCNNWGLERGDENYIEDNHELSLIQLQEINQNRIARIIGLSIETRPDYINYEELNWLRYLGVTKVEIGVQHLNQNVLDFNKREMSVAQIAEASERLRDVGLKIVYHMMPNLPESNPELDIQSFKDLYNGLYHHPDMLKVYPCMIVKGSLLYKWFIRGIVKYKSYNDDELVRTIADCEREVPNYTRIIRIIRDIPADYIKSGSHRSNLREDVDKYQKERGVKQVDIRAREIRDKEIIPEDYLLTETRYETARGTEIFLQFENKRDNLLAGFLRLRLPKRDSLKRDEELVKYDNLKVLIDSAIVRELHVYGSLKRIGEEGTQSQHTGMGKRLLARAEEIARENGYKKMSIISGVGVREYYKKRGYNLEGTYMVKEI